MAGRPELYSEQVRRWYTMEGCHTLYGTVRFLKKSRMTTTLTPPPPLEQADENPSHREPDDRENSIQLFWCDAQWLNSSRNLYNNIMAWEFKRSPDLIINENLLTNVKRKLRIAPENRKITWLCVGPTVSSEFALDDRKPNEKYLIWNLFIHTYCIYVEDGKKITSSSDD